MAQLAADGNLLFGILALQMDFISRDDLVAAMNAWLLEKHRPLADLLAESGALEPAACAVLEPLVRHHIEQHGGDPAQSLASLGSIDWIRADLAPIGEADPEVQHSLARLVPATPAPGDDPEATAAYSHPAGSSGTRSGQRETFLPPDWTRSTSQPDDRRSVRLVHDSDSPQPGSSFSLLWDRMRIGSLIILGSFLVFLVKDVWDGRGADETYLTTFWTHCAVVLTATAVAVRLWRRQSPTLWSLRVSELALLGASVLFFAQYQFHDFSVRAWGPYSVPGLEAQVISWTGDSCILRWFAFMVCYGFFVPNSWRRCATVVAGIALCPIAVTVALGVWEGTLGRFNDVLFEMVVWLGIGSSMAIYGSHKITQLRQQAFEARKLGQYRLKQRIGAGGMGEVYLAEHARLRRPCAIKLIRPDQAADRDVLLQFEREVQATAALMHANTVRIFDYGVAEDGTFYYTMEYLPGLTLQQLVREYGPLLPERAVHFLRQVCSALREAHGLGLIHRDIKPSNMIVCQLGGVPDVLKLLDFGLVQMSSAGDRRRKSTRRAYIAGTPSYLSPEQAAGRRDLDARTDIYSLGAVGYFLLAGRPPFEGRSALQLLIAHIEQPVPPLHAPGGQIPADLDAVITRCLEKDPAKRFPDAASLEQALAACECAGLWTESEGLGWWQEARARQTPPSRRKADVGKIFTAHSLPLVAPSELHRDLERSGGTAVSATAAAKTRANSRSKAKSDRVEINRWNQDKGDILLFEK